MGEPSHIMLYFSWAKSVLCKLRVSDASHKTGVVFCILASHVIFNLYSNQGVVKVGAKILV